MLYQLQKELNSVAHIMLPLSVLKITIISYRISSWVTFKDVARPPVAIFRILSGGITSYDTFRSKKRSGRKRKNDLLHFFYSFFFKYRILIDFIQMENTARDIFCFFLLSAYRFKFIIFFVVVVLILTRWCYTNWLEIPKHFHPEK